MDQGDAADLMQLARAPLGLRQDGEALSEEGNAALRLLAARQHRASRSTTSLRDEYAAVRSTTDEQIVAHLRRLHAAEAGAEPRRLRRPAALLGADARGVAGARRRGSPACTTTCSSTSTRTRTCCRRASSAACARAHRNITVVGDDAQSIYSFRGANFRNILDFPRQFPGTTIVTLEQNYRSTQPILDVTNTLISRAEERFTKNLWTTRDGRRDARGSSRRRTSSSRRASSSTAFSSCTRRACRCARWRCCSAPATCRPISRSSSTNRKIPFEKWGGLKFLEAAHVKDVLAFLRILENPRDEVSWYRILMLLPGIGDATARAADRRRWRERAWDPRRVRRTIAPPPRARDAHTRARRAARQLRGVAACDEDGGAGRERHRARSARSTTTSCASSTIAPSRGSPISTSCRRSPAAIPIARRVPRRARARAAAGTQDLAGGSESTRRDALVLSTAHSAKGKEWDAVFVIWAVDGWFPSSRAVEDDEELEEERRLMYVAMTRARRITWRCRIR